MRNRINLLKEDEYPLLRSDFKSVRAGTTYTRIVDENTAEEGNILRFYPTFV